LEENRLGNINKDRLPKKELPKGDLGRATAELLRVIPFIGRELVLLLLSSYRPYFISFYSLK